MPILVADTQCRSSVPIEENLDVRRLDRIFSAQRNLWGGGFLCCTKDFNNEICRQQDYDRFYRMPIGGKVVGKVIDERINRQYAEPDPSVALFSQRPDRSEPSQDRNRNPGERIRDIPKLHNAPTNPSCKARGVAKDEVRGGITFFTHKPKFAGARVLGRIVIGKITGKVQRSLHSRPVSQP